jgi:hypothetical protein
VDEFILAQVVSREHSNKHSGATEGSECFN